MLKIGNVGPKKVPLSERFTLHSLNNRSTNLRDLDGKVVSYRSSYTSVTRNFVATLFFPKIQTSTLPVEKFMMRLARIQRNCSCEQEPARIVSDAGELKGWPVKHTVKFDLLPTKGYQQSPQEPPITRATQAYFNLRRLSGILCKAIALIYIHIPKRRNHARPRYAEAPRLQDKRFAKLLSILIQSIQPT